MPQYFSSFQSPSGSTSSRSAVTYDYTGLDDQIKRQDELGALRDAKTAAMMGGDYEKAMGAGGRIRDLLRYTQTNAPGTTERNPVQVVNPLVRVASRSAEQSSSSSGGQAEWFRPEGSDDQPGAAGGAPVKAALAGAFGQGKKLGQADMGRLRAMNGAPLDG